MNNEAIHSVFKSTVLARLLNASPDWRGFTNASQRDRFEAFIRKSIRPGFCSENIGSFQSMCEASDEQFFDAIKNNPSHILRTIYYKANQAAAMNCALVNTTMYFLTIQLVWLTAILLTASCIGTYSKLSNFLHTHKLIIDLLELFPYCPHKHYMSCVWIKRIYNIYSIVFIRILSSMNH